jgi:hypothetical protein
MRVFVIAADVVMGLILGLFLYLALSKTWVTLQHPVVAVIVFVASVMVVLFRRPNGSLATRRNGRADR